MQERIALRKAFAQCRFPAAGYKPAVSIGETYEANRVAGRDLMIAGAVVMATAVVSALLAQQIPGLPLEKINKLACNGALLIAALHSFIALRRI